MIPILRKIFDTSDRDVKQLNPIVSKINGLEKEIQALSDDELKAKTPYFKELLGSGKTLDDIAPEAFAVVREASRRLLGMRQFDVQLLGGLVLHQGRIAEMKTGEGKTLVAVAPLYLNALTGKGVHLVTVNDYLARRDAVWMGRVYDFLGLSLGVVQGQSQESDELGGSFRYESGAHSEDLRYLNLVPSSRKEAYACDIIYGTNHEFGFDYLRDNMTFKAEDLMMRELNFAVVDEVDSILIDEARTPHIISGPSMDDVSVYNEVDKIVKQLQPELHYTADKKSHSASLTEEGMDVVEHMLSIDNIASDPKLMHHLNACVKAYGLFQRDIDYVVKNGEVVIVDENTGRMMFGRRYSDGLHQALEAKERVRVQRESQTVASITFQNLFRLYKKLAGMAGTAKTEEDEFRKIYGLDVVSIPTNRPTKRTDHEDIIYKTEEGKFRGIAREILRLHTKQQPSLVGTRSIEMSERISTRLTAEMLQRLILIDRLYDLKENSKQLDKAIKKELEEVCEIPFTDLKMQTIATYAGKANVSTDPFSDENLDWFLQKHELKSSTKETLKDCLQHGIPHNVLNAKYHEQEALIIAEAGRKGAVTIATNMAGRGVDILLGGHIEDESILKSRAVAAEEDDPHADPEFQELHTSYRRGGKVRAAPPLPLDDQERSSLAEEVRGLGGLYILGTERHESRRIDNQLRGRAGRQGDPGESRFYVSLEDHLWRIFNANMLENPLLKNWPTMEEVHAKFLTRMILKTQERIENHFFEQRKHVLEYDDVLNSQREHIYRMRREILLGKDIREDLKISIQELVQEDANAGWQQTIEGETRFDYELVYNDLNQLFPLIDSISLEEFSQKSPQELVEYLTQLMLSHYQKRIEEIGEEQMAKQEQRGMLQAINDHWMEHLQVLDYIREGINLRSYSQIDPLVAYKRETYDLYQRTLSNIRNSAIKNLLSASPQAIGDFPENFDLSQFLGSDMIKALEAQQKENTDYLLAPQEWPNEVDPTKVRRLDLCPCGSGLKFKKCHYEILKSEERI